EAFGADHEVNGVASLVVAEIKRPGIPISGPHKEQAWKYVSELLSRGLIDRSTMVHCFVLGSELDPAEADPVTRGYDRVIICPIAYPTFIRRGERRMMNLRDKLQDAPFLRDKGIDVSRYGEPLQPSQASMPIG